MKRADLRLAASGRACTSWLGARLGHGFTTITEQDGFAIGWRCRRCGLTFFVDERPAVNDGSDA